MEHASGLTLYMIHVGLVSNGAIPSHFQVILKRLVAPRVTMWCPCFRVVVQLADSDSVIRVYLHHLQRTRIPCASPTPYLCIYRRLNLNNSMNYLSRALMGEAKGEI